MGTFCIVYLVTRPGLGAGTTGEQGQGPAHVECGEFGNWEVALYDWIIGAMWGKDDKEKRLES